MYKLKYKTSISSAHQLRTAYSNECNASIHGHNWKIAVEISTKELVNDMVVDFKKLKEVIHELDHKVINEIIDIQPTAENMAKYFHDKIRSILEQKCAIILVSVEETDNSIIEYTE